MFPHTIHDKKIESTTGQAARSPVYLVPALRARASAREGRVRAAWTAYRAARVTTRWRTEYLFWLAEGT